MLDQLINIVKHFGQNAVVDNPDVPGEHNEAVMQEATHTIASGFQNILAGGGLGNLMSLFNRGGNNRQGIGGLGSLAKNPIVSMMIGYFISKLVSKFKMNPASASKVANNLIPSSIENLVNKVNDPNDEHMTLDRIIGSLTGRSSDGNGSTGGGNFLQNLLEKFTKRGNNQDETSPDDDPELHDLSGEISREAQEKITAQKQQGGGGLMDMIRGLIPN